MAANQLILIPPQQKETLTNPPNEDTNIEKFLVFDKVSVRLFNKIPSLYKMKGEKVSYWSDKWLEVFLYENSSYYYDIAGYFEIEGKPRKIEITSNKKFIANNHYKNGIFQVLIQKT